MKCRWSGRLWGEVAKYSGTRIDSNQVNKRNYIGVDNLLPNRAGKTDSSYVPTEGRHIEYRSGDVLIGNIRPYLKKIWLADQAGGTNGDVLVIRPSDPSLSSGYLHQILTDENFFAYNMQHAKGAKMPRGDKAKILEYRIPIPCPDNPKKSLAIQAEIVRILDAFTELTVELTVELTARKKQYNYYRDQLLNFENGEVEFKMLGALVHINTGSKPPEIFENATDFDYINAGTSRSGYSATSNCDGDTVTTPSRGQGGIGYVGYQRGPFWLGPLCYKLQSVNRSVLINKYLFYFLQSKNELLLSLKKEGGVPAVNKSDLVKLEIPIPTLKVQQRIVAILDKFDLLTNSITGGLPREIELRHKQYEYYRDLLLSFPKPERVAA